jgi:hypothetical protein
MYVKIGKIARAEGKPLFPLIRHVAGSYFDKSAKKIENPIG